MTSIYPSDLAGWLEYISRQHSQVIDMGLERAARVLVNLPVPRSKLGRVITVAGTNGKGSTVATLESLLLAQGFRIGVYTSPHLLRYNERVRIDGREVDDERLCRAFSAVEQARDGIALTYFEYGTLAALHCFADMEPDFCILEVGLGGRLDAVNVIDADLAIITTIGIDHVDWLGPDRESIGREKAGIMRVGAPFVCGDSNPPHSLREQAGQLGCDAYWREEAFGLDASAQARWSWWGSNRNRQLVTLADLPPVAVPVDNVAAAMQALLVFDCLPGEAVLREVLPQISVTGRFQRVADAPSIILDVGHNPQAAAYLRDRILQQGGCWKAVFSALGDKDINAIVATLADVIVEWYCAPLGVERAAGRAQLEAAFLAANLTQVRWSKNIAEALSAALRDSQPDDRILVFGSFYTVGEALLYVQNNGFAAGQTI